MRPIFKKFLIFDEAEGDDEAEEDVEAEEDDDEAAILVVYPWMVEFFEIAVFNFSGLRH